MVSAGKCGICQTARPVLRRPRNQMLVCRDCFLDVFLQEVHETIVEEALFQPGERVGLGASGGKDSTVLIDVMVALNKKYNYGLELMLISIDEGIVGYRDDSLQTVQRNHTHYQLPLTILSYQDLYGWSMDQIVQTIGVKSNCTFCGVFRRQALDRGAEMLGVHTIVTGHNADDFAETVLMNLLRADSGRLQRCASAKTGEGAEGTIPRVKPLKYAYEKEIVLYAYHKQLDYFVTECTYSKEAFRGCARAFVKEIESIQPRAIMDIVLSGEDLFQLSNTAPAPVASTCSTSSNSCCASGGNTGACGNKAADDGHAEPTSRNAPGRRSAPDGTTSTPNRCVLCGYMTSQTVCRACNLLKGLNHSKARVALDTDRKKLNLRTIDRMKGEE